MQRWMSLVFGEAGHAEADGLAALLAHRERFAGALVATPLCGGNLTEQQVRRWLLEDAPGGEDKLPDG
jgi:hypothetical protein